MPGTNEAARVVPGTKRDRTRAKLLEAARALIREKGYEHTTLEDVAQRAGMTTGAIYGNFKNRNALFIALAHTYWAPVKPRVRRGGTLDQAMRALAEATIEAIPERTTAIVGRLTGLAHTARNEQLRAEVERTTTHSFEIGAEWLRSLFDERDLPMPAEQFVRVIHALIEGLTVQRILTPQLYPNDVIYEAFAALARGAPSRVPPG